MEKELFINLAKKKIRFGWNYLFDQGKLPDFIVAGVQKGGTTFLDANLTTHSEVEMNPNFFHRNPAGKINFKEPNFFRYSTRYKKGVRWYKSLFNKNDCVQGEASPNYINDEHAIKRIHAEAPGVKLVIILRDPVARAYSHFNHFSSVPSLRKNLMCPDGDFEANITEEIGQDFMPSKRRKKDFMLIRQGFYAKTLSMVYQYFAKDQVLILISEHAKKDPVTALNTICDFIGVKPFDAELKSNVHVRDYQQPISASAEKTLYELFKPHNERLFEMLGFEVEEWTH
jgi:hypothetical protein